MLDGGIEMQLASVQKELLLLLSFFLFNQHAFPFLLVSSFFCSASVDAVFDFCRLHTFSTTEPTTSKRQGKPFRTVIILSNPHGCVNSEYQMT